jgi:predicted amidophosphoribosyltransferase
MCPNRWCRRTDRWFSVVYSIGTHEGALRDAILRYKYHGEWWWARAFARLIAGYLELNAAVFEEFDLLTGVPSYTGPGARPTRDPVAAILEHLPGLLGASWVVDPGLIVKLGETPAMQGLDWEERQVVASGELRRSLAVSRPEKVKSARVLVVDDVLAEGSTLREVARALVLAGSEEVAGLVISRPRWSAGQPPSRP